MKKSKLMLLLVPALLLVGCSTSSNNNGGSSSNPSGNGGNSSSGGTNNNDIPEEYVPLADIPDAEKGSVITAEQAMAIYNSLDIADALTQEESEQEIKEMPAVRLMQRTKTDTSSYLYKDTYSYNAKYSYFYYIGNYLPEAVGIEGKDGVNYDESWHYDYVRNVEDSPVYFDLDHQIFDGWLDLSMEGTDIRHESWDEYYYSEKPAEQYEEDQYSLKALSAINVQLSTSGAMLGTYLQFGSSSIPGMEIEIRSNGSDDLWFSMNALETMGMIMQEQVKDGKVVYLYTYTDLEKLAGSGPGGVPGVEDTGITKMVSELWFEELAVSDLQYPNEAFYKEQAGK